MLQAVGKVGRSDLAALMLLRRVMRSSSQERAYVLKMDGCEWLEDGPPTLAPDPLGRPVAVVVREGCLVRWRGYAMALALGGVVMGVFSCSEAARRWAALRAKVLFPENPRRTVEPAQQPHRRGGAVLHP